MRYSGYQNSKELRKAEYIDDPSYCSTLMLIISRLPITINRAPLKKNEKPPLPFKIDTLDYLFK